MEVQNIYAIDLHLKNLWYQSTTKGPSSTNVSYSLILKLALIIIFFTRNIVIYLLLINICLHVAESLLACSISGRLLLLVKLFPPRLLIHKWKQAHGYLIFSVREGCFLEPTPLSHRGLLHASSNAGSDQRAMRFHRFLFLIGNAHRSDGRGRCRAEHAGCGGLALHDWVVRHDEQRGQECAICGPFEHSSDLPDV